MRILWFTNTPSLAESIVGEKDVGGGWIKSLENHLVKNRGIELGIAFYTSSLEKQISLDRTQYYTIRRKAKNKTLRLLYRHLRLKEFKNDSNKYLEIINDFKPDIIHIHGMENLFGKILPKTKVPIVISIQGISTVIAHKNDRFSNNEKMNFNFIANVLLARSNRVISKSYHYYKQIEKETLTKAEYLIGRTEWDKNVTRIFAPKSKYFHSNEILRETFYKYEWKNDLKSKLIIHTTLNPKVFKGLDTIIKACSILDESEINFSWNVAGVNQNNWILKRYIDNNNIKNISKRINFLGKLNEKQLVDKLLSANIFIMTSHIENSSNALSEAMLLGLPCIATFVGGTNSLLNHKYNGLLVPDDDPWGLCGTILQYYSNFEFAKKMASNARKTGLKRHNPEFIVMNLIRIYEQVITDKQEITNEPTPIKWTAS